MTDETMEDGKLLPCPMCQKEFNLVMGNRYRAWWHHPENNCFFNGYKFPNDVDTVSDWNTRVPSSALALAQGALQQAFDLVGTARGAKQPEQERLLSSAWHILQNAIAAAPGDIARVTPEGWKLVPIDSLVKLFGLIGPAPAEVDGNRYVYVDPRPHETLAAIGKVVRAMLTAAPLDSRATPQAAPYQAAEARVSVPEGWKLVPVEPVSKMLEDDSVWGFVVGCCNASRNDLREIYTAMLALAPEPPQGASVSPRVAEWHKPEEVPPVEKGSEREFIVAVRRARTGKVYTFSCTYLNEMPLRDEWGCPLAEACGNTDKCDDGEGCLTTGWFILTGNDGEGSNYERWTDQPEDEFMGWRGIPQWAAASSSPVSQPQADIEPASDDARKLLRGFLDCPEIADCPGEDKDVETHDLERRARKLLSTPEAPSVDEAQERPLTPEEDAMIDRAWEKHKAAGPVDVSPLIAEETEALESAIAQIIDDGVADAFGHDVLKDWHFNDTAASVLKALRARQPADVRQRREAVWPDELTDDLREVLGQPNFWCAPIASAFRNAGHNIVSRSEDEQAFVLHWLAGLVLKFGADWKTHAADKIDELTRPDTRLGGTDKGRE